MKNALLLKLLEPLATLASGIGKQKKLLIMIYHRVLDEPDFMRPDEVDKERFTWHMELLSKHFNVLPLSEALERMQNDTLPFRAVSITFDDGYADNYTNALPILQQFNLTATFFIASGYLNGGRMWNDTIIESIRNYQLSELDLTSIGMGLFDVSNNNNKYLASAQVIKNIKHLQFEQRNKYVAFIAELSYGLPNNLMMTTEQLKLLHRYGMDIGGHTVNHPILAKLDEKMAKQEIVDNKSFLESLLNTRIRYFAYPNGRPNQDYLPQQIQIIRDAGYQAALSTQFEITHYLSDIWQLPRFTPWDSTPLRFMLRVFNKYCEIKII